MKIKIKKNAYIWAGSNSKQIKELEGKWVDVETDHLFTNQYNTKELRVYDSQVEAVKDDARIGKGKCKYCGTMLSTGETCNKHEDCHKYGVEWFTPENTYFLKYPSGVKSMKTRFLSIDPLNIKIGSYYLENYPELDYFRLYNSMKTINFKYDGKYFYIMNGIGYTQTHTLDIPKEVFFEIRHKLYQLNEKQEKETGKGFFKN